MKTKNDNNLQRLQGAYLSRYMLKVAAAVNLAYNKQKQPLEDVLQNRCS